ncbi:MAG: hypothetical protein NWE83_09815 [Candidatus Bathyarchaeota archaeon]|nr:hypothetical protein [Candidatus Bathyarchaeota archaeon]
MIIATSSTVYALKRARSVPDLLHTDLSIRRALEAQETHIIALTDGSLLLRTRNETRQVSTNIPDRIDALCLLQERPLHLLIGTTPPHIYRLQEDGTANLCTGFEALPVRSEWYTPWGGPPAVRSFAATTDGCVYADIHVGSIMRSPDQGHTWEPVTPTLHNDVHEVATTPASDNHVAANTYLSVYISADRGKTWHHRSNALQNRYGRGIAINPKDSSIMLCGVSDGPTGTNVHGQLYYSENAGVAWHHVSQGFPPSTRQNIDTFHIAYMDEHTAWVADEDKLYLSQDQGQTWELYWTAPEAILTLSCHH